MLDLFARPTATPERLLPWLDELSRTGSGLLDAFRPRRSGIAPSVREQVILAVTEVNGCRYTAWIHGAWRDFVGDRSVDDLLPLLLDFARDSALAGRPLDPAPLEQALPPEAVRAVRAMVAVAELSNLLGNTADGLWERLWGRRPLDPLTALREATVVVAALPMAASLFVAAGAMALAARLAPPMPDLEKPPDSDANLVVHMLADAVPQYLGNALVRATVLRLPKPIAIGFRAEGAEATLHLSRDRLRIHNGIAPEAFLIVDGGVELLLDVAGRSLSRELAQLARHRTG